MPVDEHDLARRFAALSSENRRKLLAALKQEGLSFSDLPIVRARTERKKGGSEIPISYAQMGLWLTWKLDPLSPAYNMAGAITFKGNVNVSALGVALRSLVERHEILRTVYPAVDAAHPYQKILPGIGQELTVTDLRMVDSSAQHEKAERVQHEFALRPFELGSEPPLRAALWQLKDDHYVLGLSIHHIASDAWSLRVLMEDYLSLYRTACEPERAELEPLPLQFADYAVWQRNWFEAGEKERQLAFWQVQLGSEHTALALPFDRPRDASLSRIEGRHTFVLSADLSNAMRTVAQKYQATTFMIMLALLKFMLCRFSGQADIRVGAPVANRSRAQTHGMVGYLTNIVVLRTQVRLTGTFANLLAAVRKTVLEAQAHSELPFDLLVNALNPERQAGVHPLFQVKCTQHDATLSHWQLPDLDISIQELSTGQAHFDLSLDFVDKPDVIEAAFVYDRALFDPTTIERFEQAFRAMAECIATIPEVRLEVVPMSEPLATISGDDVHYPNLDILAMWDASVALHPERIAVRDETCSLTYAALDARTDFLAGQLMRRGIGAESRVGLHADRNCEFIVGLIAVLKVGAAFVPLDPQLPADRLLYQIEDSQSSLLLTAHMPVWQTMLPVLLLNAEANVTADRLARPVYHPYGAAYLIYTSGSTGRPKGVVVSRGALTNYVQAVLERLDIPNDALQVAMVSTVAADLGHTSLFGALCSGRTLHLIDRKCAFDPDQFGRYMAEHEIDVLKIVPSHLQGLMQGADLRAAIPLHRLILGGEATSLSLLEQIKNAAPYCQVFNHYGPTETTVGVLTHAANSTNERTSTLPIGLPLNNIQLVVVDADLCPVPAGVAGELCVGGAGVARGYHSRGSLTADRFVASILRRGERMYRTGDRVLQLADGSIEYLGRNDDQVKIRGYRVELREVALAILEHCPVLRQAEVIARIGDEGRNQLIAYVVSAPGAVVHIDQIRESLLVSLPGYMVPAAVIQLDVMPLTENGKVDRKALPAYDGICVDRFEAPQGHVEQALADIWAKLLQKARISRHDNFFMVGGDSIVALQVIARARKIGVKVTPKQIMELQTIAAIAAVAVVFEVADAKAKQPQVQETTAPTCFDLTPVQCWFFEQRFAEPHHWNQSVTLTPAGDVDIAYLRTAIGVIVSAHEAPRTQFVFADGRWQQFALPPDESEYLEVHYVNDLAQASAVADETQRSLTLDRPFKAIWIDVADHAGFLVLIAHHLVVDGMSWRIILDDLQSAYRQLGNGRVPDVDAPSTRFGQWCDALMRRARSETIQAELPYWESVLGSGEPPLPGKKSGSNLVADESSIHLSLDERQSERLLNEVPRAYRTQLNEVLLAALAQTLCAWSGRDSVLVEVEGHGRDAFDESIDLERTVGWFTCLYPVRLTSGDHRLGARLKSVKEALRRVPNKGVGYGILRYLSEHAPRFSALPYPQVTFNYLGQLDQAVSGDAMWRLARDQGSAQRAPSSRRRTWIAIDAAMRRGKLDVRWTYSSAIHDHVEIARLVEAFQNELAALIEHCCSGAAGITPSDFPLAVATQEQLDRLPIPHGRIADLYPLSPMQAGMLFHDVLDPGGTKYLNQLRIDVDNLDTARFIAAWQQMFRRHEVLRSGFLAGEHALQWVASSVTVPIVEQDITGDPNPAKTLDQIAEADLAKRFDVSMPPLMRFAIIKVGPGRHHFIWTRHHLLLDGWSTAKLLTDVMRVYSGASPNPRRGRFRDFVHWLQNRDASTSEAYWKTRLATVEQPTLLADSFRRPDDGGTFSSCTRVFDTDQTALARAYASATKITLNTLVQAAWALVLKLHTGSTQVCFGATTSGRPETLPDVEETLGLFINTLPVVAQVTPGRSIRAWLGELQSQNVLSREHEHTPLFTIQKIAGCGGRALFDSIVVFENYPIDESFRRTGTDSLRFSVKAIRDETHYPLVLTVISESTLSFSFGFDGKVFSGDDVERLADRFVTALTELVASAEKPNAVLGDVDLLTEDELLRLRKWGGNLRRYPSAEPVHRLIERQAQAQPAAVALLFREDVLTYAQLDVQANRLAHRLIASGVTPEVKVGIAVERSVEMVVALLAILKAGAAYVPLDPEYPADRLAYMVEDSDIGLLLTQSWIRSRMPAREGLRVLELDSLEFVEEPTHNPCAALNRENLAYVIYTSGSTGRPKGVGITHRSLVEHTQAAIDFFGLTTADRMLQFATLNFDGCIEQLFPPLVAGASVVLRDPALWDSTLFHERLLAKKITVVDLTTAYWLLLIQDLARRGILDYGELRQVHVGGEAMPPEGLKAWRDAGLTHVKLQNTYGPTEATVTASILNCQPYVDGSKSLPPSMPIGLPLAGRMLWVVDEGLNCVPEGVIGELLIGGELLARGYLCRGALSSERFIADPFDGKGNRLYRTGDLARWNSEGQLEYFGRVDHQVKIRGLRIELGEIESQLLAGTEVREAVVVAKDGPGGATLIGYVSARSGKAIEPDQLRQQLSKKLPDYMVPSAIVVVEALPLNASGKVDRAALPEPGAEREKNFEEPQGEREKALAAIWADVLQVERVGRHDSFFELGGHSLLAARLLERMRARGMDVPVRTLFQQPKLSAFAQAIAQDDVRPSVDVPPNLIPLNCKAISPKMLTLVELDAEQIACIEAMVPGGASNIQDIYPLAPLQEGILFHHMLEQQGDAYVTPCLLSFDSRERLERFIASFNQVIARHDILRTAVLWEGLKEPVQVVLREAPLQIDWYEARGSDGVAEQLNAQVDPRHHRIDVRRAPMVRAVAAQDTAQGRWLLQLPSHHLVLDHTTLELIVEEIALIQQGRETELAEPVPFRRFVAQARLGVSPAEHEAFFRKMLSDVDEPTAPFGLLDVRGDGSQVEEVILALDARLSEQIRHQARRHGVSAASVFHLAWALVLARTSGKNDVVFGTVLFGRMQGGEGAERALGMFINTLPIRVKLVAKSVLQALRETHASLTDLLHHEHASLALAQRCSGLPGGTTLFSALLNYRYSVGKDRDKTAGALDGMKVLGGFERSNYPVDMSVNDLGQGFELVGQVSKAHSARRICDYFQTALASLVHELADSGLHAVDPLEVLGKAELVQLKTWGANTQRYPRTEQVHRLIEVQAQARSESVALILQDQTLTYGELNKRANRLAHRLVRLGVGPDVKVGLAVDRSIDMVIGLLGVLKAGGVYVPLDPDYPVDRLAYMIQDSRITLLLALASTRDRLSAATEVLSLELDSLDLSAESADNPKVQVHGENLAYVIYTSGSTGRPKGVGIPHHSLVEHVQVAVKFFGLTEADRMLQFATLNFDGCIEQLFPPLIAGATVVLRGPLLWDSTVFHQQLLAQHISVVDITTTYWMLLVQDFARNSIRDYGVLRQVHVGGEAMPPEGLNAWREAGLTHVKLLNTYGPTEATVTASILDCEPYVSIKKPLPPNMPIGKPLPGRALWVVDGELNCVPQGVPGELLIGGDLLARGYLGRAALTAERFVADLFGHTGGRLYRTGDLVRWNADGQLDYLGRIDHQVKIRGLRIEMGEIEAQLLTQPEVREAVVMAKPSASGACLVAYVSVQPGRSIEAALLRQRLSTQLPYYMVPTQIMILEALPLNANGKVDRKALPESEFKSEHWYEAPQGETEGALAAIWAEVLHVERVGRHDNFFELGGHSLSVMQMVARVQAVQGVNLAVRTVFAHPTLSVLASLIKGEAGTESVLGNLASLDSFIDDLEVL